MSDLLQRLREPERTIARCRELLYVSADTAIKAADEIDRLSAEVERLRMTPQERDAMEFFADLPWAKESDNAVEAEAIRGFLDRHDNGGAA